MECGWNPDWRETINLDLKAIERVATNPLVLSAVGAVGGYLLKSLSDVWTSETKRRQDFATHVIGQIEIIAPTYYLMANNAYLLSFSLNQYLEMKRDLQLLPLDEGFSPNDNLQDAADRTAKDALFYAGKLYRVMTDSFWVKGGRYLLPDRWANKSIEDLHNGLMASFNFDPQVLLRYIQSETDLNGFYEALNKGRKDLREEFERFRDWLKKQERQVMYTVFYAQAYSDLFGNQLDRLYKDWFTKEFWWGAQSSDPLKAKEVVAKSDALFDETRQCISQAAKERLDKEARRSGYLIAEMEADAGTLTGEAAFNLGWNFYGSRQFDLAVIAYQYALQKLGPGSSFVAATHNNLGNVYTTTKQYKLAEQAYQYAIGLDEAKSIFHKNLGSMYNQNGAYEDAVRCYQKAAEIEPEGPAKMYLYNYLGNALSQLGEARRAEAIECYRQAIALDPLQPVLYDNLAGMYEESKEYQLAINVSQESARLATSQKASAAECYLRLGRLYESLEKPKWDEAISAYSNAVNSNPDLKYVKALVEACRKSGRLKDIPNNTAIQMSKIGPPRSLGDIKLLADIYASWGDDNSAADQYDRWIRRSYWERLLSQGVLLQYKLAVNQIMSYKLEFRSINHIVELNDRKREPLQFVASTQQKVLAVKPDGTYEIEVRVKTQPPAQDAVMTLVMSKSGDYLWSSRPDATPPAVPFPEKEVHRGETWVGKLPIPVASGKNEDIPLVYTLAEIEVRKNRTCAHITVSGNSLNVNAEEGVEQQTSAMGDTWFDFENGVLVESHVESRVVVTGGDAWATLSTMIVDLELIENLIPEPEAHDRPEQETHEAAAQQAPAPLQQPPSSPEQPK